MKPEEFEKGKVYCRNYPNSDIWEYCVVTRKLDVNGRKVVWGLPIEIQNQSVRIGPETVCTIFDDWVESYVGIEGILGSTLDRIRESWRPHVEINF